LAVGFAGWLVGWLVGRVRVVRFEAVISNITRLIGNDAISSTSPNEGCRYPFPSEAKTEWTLDQIKEYIHSNGRRRPRGCTFSHPGDFVDEEFELNHAFARAADLIKSVDAILVASAASMSVDSGLGTFRCAKAGHLVYIYIYMYIYIYIYIYILSYIYHILCDITYMYTYIYIYIYIINRISYIIHIYI
jgi:hypothetical protein